jgi:transcriptional regulator with XRE-family HTH domain
MIYKNIGQRISKAREEAGLSQEELASRLGYTQAALSNYELGKRRLYLASIEQIAKELNKPLSYFLDDPAEKAEAETEKLADDVLTEISKLLADMPKAERRNILEYIQWRKERLK